MLFRIIDIETTGIRPEDEICEVGFCDLKYESSSTSGSMQNIASHGGSCLVRTTKPMPPEAQAIHHISQEDITEYGVSFPEAWAYMLRYQYGGADERTADAPPHTEVSGYVAHNAAFEQQFVGRQWTGNVPWICTMKCAMRVWPHLPAFGNQVLRYALNLPIMNHGRTLPTHAAAPDAYVTAHILAALLEKHTPPELAIWSGEPAQWPRVMFGKHKGQEWNEVPSSYLTWMIGNQGEADWADWQACAQRELDRRRGLTRTTARAVK